MAAGCEGSSTQCNLCLKTCVDLDQALQCDLCKFWWHNKCSKVSKAVQAAFNEYSMHEVGFKWFCPTCQMNENEDLVDSCMVKILELKQNVEKLKTDLLNKLEDVETKIASKVESKDVNLQQKISSYADVITNNIAETTATKKVITSIESNFKALQTNMENKKVEDEESKLRKIKEMNICIFQLPESKNKDPQDSYKEDIQKLKKVFENHATIKSENIKAVFRIGKVSNTSKPRPIIMKFTNCDQRAEILKLRNLYYIDEELGTKTRIFTAPDRTPKEQEVHKGLVAELKQRRSNGEENLVIRNGKVITIQPFQRNPQLLWG